MALLHKAQLTPTKLELLDGWVFSQSWFPAGVRGELSNVAAYRFDDPEGEVGVETIFVGCGGNVTVQVPLTYRNAVLEGAESHLIGTMQHSVLGKRWVYDGAADPVYLQTAASAALNGGHQAELFVDTAEGRIARTPNALVSGTGSASLAVEAPRATDVAVRQEGSITIVDAGPIQVRIQRVIGGDPLRAGTGDTEMSALAGTWTGSDVSQELVLASLT